MADPATVEPWATLLVENDPGFVVGESPILIIHGEQDEQIPVVSARSCSSTGCAASARSSSAAPTPGRATPGSSGRRSPTCSSGSTRASPARSALRPSSPSP